MPSLLREQQRAHAAEAKRALDLALLTIHRDAVRTISHALSASAAHGGGGADVEAIAEVCARRGGVGGGGRVGDDRKGPGSSWQSRRAPHFLAS